MSRNSSGNYSLPQAAFVAGTAIVATPVNSNFSDIATALTLSLPLDGSAAMTGPIKGFAGTPSAPGYMFASSPGVGFYLNEAESGMAIVIASTSVVLFTSASATNNFGTYWQFQHRFVGSVDFNGGVIFANGLSATVTISGDLIITKGLNVGFLATPTSNVIAIGDANFNWSNDGSNPLIAFDSGDLIRYNRTSNSYEAHIANVTTYSINSTSVQYTGYIRNPEQAAPSTPAANNVVMYVKDNSGTSRVYYKNSTGTEVPMGGPGGWEEISSFTVTASTASIVFSLSKVYSRLALCGVNMSGTADANRALLVEISDDAGATYETALQGGFGGFSGTVIGVMATNSSPMRESVLTAAANDLAFYIEFLMCHEAAAAKPFCGHAASFTDARGFFGSGQTAVCDDIDAMRVRWSTGTLIDAGILTLYGEIAR